MDTNLLLRLPEIKQKIRKFYDVSSPYWLELWGKHIHDGYYVTGKESKEEAQENLIRLLADKANIQMNSKILDVGCGIGGTSIYLAKNFNAHTTGITISPVQVEIAKQQARQQNISSAFLVMDAEKMNFLESFGVLWIVGVLTHFINQESFIKRGAKFLNRGGKFILGDWMVAENITGAERKKYVDPVLEGMLMPNSYSINTYLQWFTKHGYRIVYAEDITVKTTKTWDIALSIIKKPAVYKLAYREGSIFINFIKCIRAMRRAMQEDKLRYGVIVAEKL